MRSADSSTPTTPSGRTRRPTPARRRTRRSTDHSLPALDALRQRAVGVVGDADRRDALAASPPGAVLLVLGVLADDDVVGGEVRLGGALGARREAAVGAVLHAALALAPHLVAVGRRLAAPDRAARAIERRRRLHRVAHLRALLAHDRLIT